MSRLLWFFLVFQATYRVGCECGGERPQTDSGIQDAGIELQDGGLQDGGSSFLRLLVVSDGGVVSSRDLSVDISGDVSAQWWCLSETQMGAPQTGCSGGQGPIDGGFSARPASLVLSPGDGAKTLFLWVSPGSRLATASVVVEGSPVPIRFHRWPAKVSFSRQAATRVSGGCTEVGGRIELTGDATGSATCFGDGGWATTLDFGGAPEGSLTLFGTQTRVGALLTSSPARKSMVKKTVACSPTAARLAVPYAAGDGGLTSPFLLCTSAQLRAIDQQPSATFELGDDIDLSTVPSFSGLNPGGTFSGRFDGQHFSLVGARISSGDSNVGLFSTVSGRIERVLVEDVQVLGAAYTGGLVGFTSPGSLIRDCHVSGTVDSTVYHVGGLAGHTEGDVEDCSSSVILGSSDGGSGGYAGGALVGHHYAPGTIRRSFATGLVSVRSRYLGGLVGRCEGPIEDAYATGSVTAFSGSYVGGFAGELISNCTVTRSFSSGFVDRSGPESGGFSGNAFAGAITASFWNSDSSGTLMSPEGRPLSSADFRDPSRFMGWDFATVWMLDAGAYPTLRANPE